MNTTPNANNQFKEAFSALFNKPGSPFQGANITIENLTIQMAIEPTSVKEGSTQEIVSLKQTPDSEVDESLSSDQLAKDVVESEIKLEKAEVSESIQDMMYQLECSFILRVYAIGDNGYMYLPDPDKKSFTLEKIKEFERDTIIVAEIESYHKDHVIKNRWQKTNKDQWSCLAGVTEKSSLERSVFSSSGSMEFDSNQVSSLNILDWINNILELTKKFPEKYPFKIKAVNSDIKVIALHSLESKGYHEGTPERAEMKDKLDGYSIGTRVVFTNDYAGNLPTAIVKIGEDNWYVMSGFDAYEHLRDHSSFAEKQTPVKKEPVVSESIKAMMYMIEGFNEVSLEAITPAGHRQTPEYVEGCSCFSLKEIDEFEIGTEICIRVEDKDSAQMVKYRWWKVTKDHWDRLPDCMVKQTTKHDQNNATSYYSSGDVEYQIKERLAIAKSYKGLEVSRIDLVYPESKTSILLESGQFEPDELEATPTGTKIILTGATRAGVNPHNVIVITWSKQTNDLWDKQVTYELFSDWHMPLNSKEISTFELTESINNINDTDVEVFSSHEPHLSRSKLDFDENKRIRFFEFLQWYMVGTMIIVKSKFLTQSWIRKTNQGWTKLPDLLVQDTTPAVENLTTQMAVEQDVDRESTANFDCKPLTKTITTDELCFLLIKMPVSPVAIYSKDEKLRSTFSTRCQDLLWLLNTSEPDSVLGVTVLSKKGTYISNYNYRKESNSQWSQIKAVLPSKH